MKKVILLSFVLLFVGACKKRICISPVSKSVIIDERCLKLQDEAMKKGLKLGVCYDGPLLVGVDIKQEEAHPDYKACRALFDEARKKCDALPPDPDSEFKTSETTIFNKDGDVFIDGELVSTKGLPLCSKCEKCKPVSPDKIRK